MPVISVNLTWVSNLEQRTPPSTMDPSQAAKGTISWAWAPVPNDKPKLIRPGPANQTQLADMNHDNSVTYDKCRPYPNQGRRRPTQSAAWSQSCRVSLLLSLLVEHFHFLAQSCKERYRWVTHQRQQGQVKDRMHGGTEGARTRALCVHHLN